MEGSEVLMKMPLHDDPATNGACIGQPDAVGLFDRMRTKSLAPCKTSLECRYWSADLQSWDTRGCETITLTDGSMGCRCTHLSDFIAVQVRQIMHACDHASMRSCNHAIMQACKQ